MARGGRYPGLLDLQPFGDDDVEPEYERRDDAEPNYGWRDDAGPEYEWRDDVDPNYESE